MGDQEHATGGGFRCATDRFAGSGRCTVRARRLAASRATRRDRRTVRRGPRRRRRLLGPIGTDRNTFHGVPVRCTGNPDVPDRRPGELGPRRTAAVPRPRRRTGQDSRASHRIGRSAFGAGRRRRRRAGGGDHARGRGRQQAAGGLRRRVRGSGAGARDAGAAPARLHGPGRGRRPAGTAGHGQRQARHPRAAGTGIRCGRVPGPGQPHRGDPGRRVRAGPRHRAGRCR